MIDLVIALAFGVSIATLLGIAAVRGDDRSRRTTPRRPGPYSSSARGFPPPPPPPRTRREYIYSPATMAECGGPCWEAMDPRACDCGALWRDSVLWDEGRIQRGHGHGGATTPKPEIIPKPQFPPPRVVPGDLL